MKPKLIVFILLAIVVLGILPPLSAAQANVDENGPYQMGIRALLLKDENRDNRSVQAFVWYPAEIAKDAKPPYPPDTSGGKYPLIIYSHGYGQASSEATGNFQRWVSQGYVVAAVDHHDPPANQRWVSFINRPLDILDLINQVSALNDSDLGGIIDMDNIGILGGSMGGYTAFAAAGARVDPAHFLEWCPTYFNDSNYYLNFDACSQQSNWDMLLQLHDKYDPPSPEVMWAPTTDNRIKAIMVIAPCYAQMFGEKGLASLTVPTLIVGGTADHTCPYDIDAAYYYQTIAAKDRYLISLKDRDHSGTWSIPGLDTHYASAFFGRYLQGKTDYAQYLTPDSTNAYKDVTFESSLVAQPEKISVADDGPYGIGVQITNFTDESRNNRELQAYIWYPALTPKGAKPPYEPDTTGAPYPLVIYSHGYGSNPTEASGVFINHLVSQGYIVAGVDHMDTNDLNKALTNRPLDVHFLLNQLANLSADNPLSGLINTDDVGLIGYSAGSYTSIVAGGAGLDSSEIDERIKAIGLIAPCFAEGIGAKGISAVTLPTILFAAEKDTTCPPESNADYYYQNLTSPDHYLLNLQGRNHGTVMDRQVLQSYISAFLGLYLQDKTDYAQYLTPDSASAFRQITLEAHLADQ